MKKPNGIILSRQYETSFSYLSDQELASLIRALFYYANTEECPEEIVPTVRPLFEVIKLGVQHDFMAYDERCRIYSENGKKGGRPRKDPTDEKNRGFLEKAEKANNNNNININNNFNNNNNFKEEVNKDNDNDADADDLAARGMVSLSSKAPPPPSSEDREKFWEELMELGVPSSYAEARLARAYHFARTTKRSISEILYEWWQEDKQGSPKNAEPPPPDRQKSYDLEDFFQAALARSYEDMEWA